MSLPERFTERMRGLLLDEWPVFLRESQNIRQYGLRVNNMKIETEEFRRIAPFHLTPIPWISNGFYYDREDQPARHPFYAGGLYYLQEPSAMTPASRLKVFPGDKVLDLCAAPGGKATELAANLRGEGLIVANDINQARARALLRNMELFGIENSKVTCEAPYKLAGYYPEYFDKIMVDAPCSGEGMFRKNPAVMESWKEKGPEYFSAIQRDIILHAADMLKPGGRMLYSTCTFAPEENEGVITHLLCERPEMELVPMEDYEGFSPGLLSFEGYRYHESCILCRRIWPHRMSGEGHFLALLAKKGEKETGKQLQRKKKKGSGSHRKSMGNMDKKADKEAMEALHSFLGRTHIPALFDCLDIRGDKVYYVPEPLKDLGPHFLRNGVYLGNLKKKRFEPSEPFALMLSGTDFEDTISMSSDDERLIRYLYGEDIVLDDIPDTGRREERKRKGWQLLLADGYPLGWGKITGSVLKNKYPSGWRRKPQ